MDFKYLDECWQFLCNDDSKTIINDKNKLSSVAVKELFDVVIKSAEEKGFDGRKQKKRKKDVIDAVEEPRPSLPVPQQLAESPIFHHAVVLCGVNSYKELRKCHPALADVLPDYKKVWKEKVKYSTDVLMPMMKIHELGLELNIEMMLCHAMDVFDLWGEKLVTIRFHYDAAKIGVTVFGFSVIHPTVPSDSNYGFFPVAVYNGPETAYFLRQQAPVCVEMLETYAKNWLDSKNGGFVMLSSEKPGLKYQIFVCPDLCALTGSTVIEGCLVCPMTWQDTRAAFEPTRTTLRAYYDAYKMEGKVNVEIGDDEAVYVYGKKNGKGTFVVHKILEEDERMIAPRFLPTRLYTDLLQKVADSLGVRVGMLVPDYMLHGVKRLVEKMIRGALVLLLASDLEYKEKIQNVACCVMKVNEWTTQASDLTFKTWLDDKNAGAGQVHLMSRDAKELLPHLEEIMEILSLEGQEDEFKSVGRSLKEFIECLRTGPSVEQIESGEYLKKLGGTCLRATQSRHQLFGAENDGLYEHMMHMVVEWEEMLISRGVCFRLFSMQAAEAYNQRLTRDLRERTQNHPLLTVGRVKTGEEEERKQSIIKSVRNRMKQWKAVGRDAKKEELRGMTKEKLKDEARKVGVRGYTNMKKVLLIETYLLKLDDLKEQDARLKALRKDELMFGKAVRGWNLVQAICNEFALKRYLEQERAKGRGGTNKNVWTSEETETRMRGLWELGVEKMEEVKKGKTSAAKRLAEQQAALKSPVSQQKMKLAVQKKKVGKKKAVRKLNFKKQNYKQ
jgi:hypothetical protein